MDVDDCTFTPYEKTIVILKDKTFRLMAMPETIIRQFVENEDMAKWIARQTESEE